MTDESNPSSPLLEWLKTEAKNFAELLNGLAFGDQSQFASAFQAAVSADRSRQSFMDIVAKFLPENGDSNSNALECLKHQNLNLNEIKNRLSGIRSFLTGLTEFVENRQQNQNGLTDNVKTLFLKSIRFFNKSWPSLQTPARTVWQLRNGIESQDDPIQTIIIKLRGCLPSTDPIPERGLNVLGDLLHRFLDQSASDDKPRNIATTPVLLCESGPEEAIRNGRVVWLTVELIADGGVGFTPDLISLGLTSLAHGGDDSFLNVMDRMWQYSGIEKRGFRGVWKLSTKCPVSKTAATLKEPNKASEFDAARFDLINPYGRSIECAALVTILAASGKIDFDGQPLCEPEICNLSFVNGERTESVSIFPAMALHPRIAVSATVNVESGESDPDKCKLGEVNGIDAKLSAASDYKLATNDPRTLLDTVLLSKGRNKSDKESSMVAELESAGANYHGVTIEDAATVGDALNWMLEVNAWKKAWNQAGEAEWLKMWGYARNESGQFLRRDNEQAILFEPQPEEKFDQFSGCQIVLNDDTQMITLRLNDGENGKGTGQTKQLEEALENGLRQQLETVVQRHGLNTGSLEYMKNPIGGAVQAEPTDSQSEEESDDVMGDES